MAAQHRSSSPGTIRYADTVEKQQQTKQVAPAADRNKQPILDVLRAHLSGSPTRLLEVASGTGQHAAFFVQQGLDVIVQPTDMDAGALVSIEAYRAESDAARFLPPMPLDVCDPSHVEAVVQPQAFDAVLCCNMIHIAPPACTPGLLSVASRALRPGGQLFLYGPFLVDGKPTTDSNAAFDLKLKGMDPSYGLKDVEFVAGLAKEQGLVLKARLDMPANNFMMVFAKE